MKDNKPDKRWMERIPEGQQPSDDAIRRIVEQDEDRFLAAKQRAMQAVEDEAVLPVRGYSPSRLGWTFAGALAIVCMAYLALTSGKVDVPNLIATPVVANYLSGIEGSVISNHDLRPVCSVEVYEHFPGDAKPGTLIDITDSFGMFNAAPSDRDEASTLFFMYEGEEVGTLVMDKNLHDSMGYEKVQINLHREQTSNSAIVELNPGDYKNVLPGIHLTLSSVATQPWTGTVLLDRNWPGHFAYCQCLEGLLRIEGVDTGLLEVTINFEAEKLELFRTDASGLKVITFSEKYKQQQDNDVDTSWREASHNGWHDIADEYLLDLDQEANGVQHQIPTVSESDSSAAITWIPMVGNDYAVLASVPHDGRAVACWYSCYRGNEHSWYPTIKLIERTRPVSSLFEYRYYPEDEEGYYTDPSMLDRNHSDFSFYGKTFTRNHAPRSQALPALLEDGTFGVLPGEFQLVRYDFSLSNPVAYPKVVADFSNPPGNYMIEVQRNSIGEKTILTVTGDTSRLEERPQWDFYGDFISEKFGLSVDFRPTHTGDYNYKVILEEKCGNVVVLERALHFPASWAMGYIQLEGDNLVIPGTSVLPVEANSLTAYSEYAVRSPAAYGVSTGTSAGPFLCIDPPDEFRDVPLKEMIIHLYARGVAGDYRQMPLNAHVMSVRKLETVDEFGLWQFEVNSNFSKLLESMNYQFLDMHGHVWRANGYNLTLKSPGNTKTATQMLNGIRTDGMDASAIFMQNILGIDLLNLAPEAELVAKLDDFGKSPYLCINYATDKLSDLVYRAKLYDGVIAQDDYILIRIKMEDAALPVAGQWELYSGGEHPSRVEIEAVDGRVFTTYFDYSPIND